MTFCKGKKSIEWTQIDCLAQAKSGLRAMANNKYEKFCCLFGSIVPLSSHWISKILVQRTLQYFFSSVKNHSIESKFQIPSNGHIFPLSKLNIIRT